MIKKELIAAGSLITAFALTVGLVMAQTSSPSPTESASPTVTVPTGAPSTGMGGY